MSDFGAAESATAISYRLSSARRDAAAENVSGYPETTGNPGDLGCGVVAEAECAATRGKPPRESG